MIKVGSDFSGVGAFDQALNRLGIEHKTIFACDKDKFARQTYLANYKEPGYFPTDVYEREIPKDSLDIYMTSPPCQSFSLAGKRLGKEDKRGVLFFNSLEFIQSNKPRFFIFENVKGLLSDNAGQTFSEWINLLGGKSINGNTVLFPYKDSVPYHIYYKVLNAKDYGVPQNRERIFIVGIRDDQNNDFRFPKEEPLKKRLKDVLETEVAEKYYLSEQMVLGIKNSEFISSTPKVALNLSGGKWDKTHEICRRVYDADAIAPTLHTCGGGNQEPKILQKAHGYNQGNEFEIAPTLTSNSWQENNFLTQQIRKLTPLECFRLMDFPDTLVQNAKKVGISDSQLYKQAGNSIVVAVLEKIIKNLKI